MCFFDSNFSLKSFHAIVLFTQYFTSVLLEANIQTYMSTKPNTYFKVLQTTTQIHNIIRTVVVWVLIEIVSTLYLLKLLS